MTTIIDSLIVEHTLLVELFDAIDALLPDLQTVAEVRLLSRLVEAVLSRHADVEQNLAFAALDHALIEKGRLDRLYQDHDEIDECFGRARAAGEFSEAVRLLKEGLVATRDHFRREEQTVFPLFKQVFDAASLETLGAATSSSASVLGTHGFGNALRSRLQRAASLTAPPG